MTVFTLLHNERWMSGSCPLISRGTGIETDRLPIEEISENREKRHSELAVVDFVTIESGKISNFKLGSPFMRSIATILIYYIHASPSRQRFPLFLPEMPIHLNNTTMTPFYESLPPPLSSCNNSHSQSSNSDIILQRRSGRVAVLDAHR